MPTFRFFFCAQSVWTYNEVAIELAAAVFIKRLQQHGHEFRDEVNFWRRKRYRIWLDSFLYLSWFTATNADKHNRLLVLLVLNGIKETPVWRLDSVNAMFLNCLCSSIFLENSRVYFPFLFTDCWPVILGSVFLDVADSARSNNFARPMCVVSLRSRQRHQKQRLLFCQYLNYKFSSDRQV